MKSKPKPVNLSVHFKSTITSNLDNQDFSEPQLLMSPMGVTTGDPTDVKTKPDEAPYSVALDHEVVSTLSGSLSVQETDMTLPGRNGLGFALTRSYNSGSAQLFGMATLSNGTTINNTTEPSYEEKMFPIGAGWSWNIPSIEYSGTKRYLHLADGGTYELVGTNLNGYPWKDITLASDRTVTVNGLTSLYALKSISGINLYFSNTGLLIQKSDQYGNKVLFKYSYQGSYGNVLSQIQDAIGNTISITYASDKVMLTKGSETVTYNKTVQDGKELLTQVIDPIGRSTGYDYDLQTAYFNLLGTSPGTSNPYALLSGITYPTGGKTIYSYEATPVTRYVGSSSVNQAFRIASREDRIYKTDDTFDVYNHKDITYSGDMGSSYNQTITFTTTVDDGLTTSVFTNQKDCADPTIPPTYYSTNVTTSEKAGTLKRSTTNSFDTGRHWYWPISTSTVMTDTATSTSSPVVTTSRSFDDYGNITLEIDPMGTRTTYVFDATTHLLSSVSQPISATQTNFTEYQRNTQGSITQVAAKENDSNGAILSLTKYGDFDMYGNVQSITFCKTAVCDAAGSIVKTLEYSSTYQNAFLSKSTSSVKDIDGVSSNVIKQYAYNTANGQLTSVTTGDRVTSYQYDALGRIVQATHAADGTSVKVVYDDFNNILTTSDETGMSTVSNWNPLGWKTDEGVVHAKDYEAKAKYGYDAYGRIVWSEDAIGNRTMTQYDAWNRQKTLTYPDSYSASVQYNDILLTKTTTDPENYAVRETMDKLGRVTKKDEIKASGTTTVGQYTFDLVGNVRTAIDANSNTTTYQYDTLSRLSQVTNAKSETTTYTYDLLGRPTTTTFPDSNIKITSYDDLGRAIQTTDANGKTENLYYDANGNRTKFVDRNGTIFTYQYTNRDFLWKKIAPDETITFTYDAAGRRTSMTDITGTTSYAYDPYYGLLKTQTYPDMRTIQYDYDPNGSRRSMTDPFGANVYYSYDLRNRLQSVGQAIGENDAVYQYFKNDLLKSITQKNGVTSTYTYDGLQLNTLAQTKADLSVLNSFSYQYDLNKNITQVVDPNGTSNYKYDKLNRIEMSDQSNQSYTYDSRGNRNGLQSVNPPNSPDAMYGYDKRDRLTSVTIGTTAVTYKYNGDGLLWERTENGQTTRYYNDGADVIAEATVTGGVTSLKARYERGISLIARQGADLDKQYYLQNGHGDVIELRDSTGNTSLNQYTYDVWGNPLTKIETVAQPFRYSGEMWDETTELQYLRARWYDPSIGRFINEDTYEGQIENPLSLNLYTYVENNPLTNNDPTGHWCTSADGMYSHPGTCNDSRNNVRYEDDMLHDGDLILNGPNFVGPPAIYNYPYELRFARWWFGDELAYTSASPQVQQRMWEEAKMQWVNVVGDMSIELLDGVDTIVAIAGLIPGEGNLVKLGWTISKSAIKGIEKLWGKAGLKVFEKAADKGLVTSMGSSGIKKLASPIAKNGRTYTHEVKVLNKEQSEYRIYGYKDEGGNFVFDYFDKALH